MGYNEVLSREQRCPAQLMCVGLFQAKALTIPWSGAFSAFGDTSRSRREAFMSSSCKERKNIQGHPCFGGNHHKNGRMHLAVAPRCNIKCGYCSRRHDCANESRPGVTSRVLTPEEAILKVREVMASDLLGPIIKVIGIAGPGDPLANDQTFETFRLVKEEFPHLILCMSTNGLLLPEKIDLLQELDLHSLTVTVNALDPVVAGKIYSFIQYHGKTYSGVEAGRILLANQLEGIARAADYGMTIKINTVLIPGVNEGEVAAIGRKVKELGAFVMNVMPLIPQSDFADVVPPTTEELEEVRRANEQIIGQFKHCRQCRADAVGLIGQDIAKVETGCALP
jgi:nitrogen fixation protein NifB